MGAPLTVVMQLDEHSPIPPRRAEWGDSGILGALHVAVARLLLLCFGYNTIASTTYKGPARRASLSFPFHQGAHGRELC
jgi:hypothetical protein